MSSPDPERVREARDFLDGWDVDAPWVDAAFQVLDDWLAGSSPDYEAAWQLYYEEAERRRNPGLTFLQVKTIVDAAFLIGRVEHEPHAPNI